MKNTRRLVSEETDRQFGERPVAPTRLLAALHEKCGRGWHIWHEDLKLLIFQMDGRWRLRITLTVDPTNGIWYPKFAPAIPPDEHEGWMLWFAGLADREWIRRQRSRARHGQPRPGKAQAVATDTYTLGATFRPIDGTWPEWIQRFARMIRVNRGYDVVAEPQGGLFYITQKEPSPLVCANVELLTDPPWVRTHVHGRSSGATRRLIESTLKLYAHNLSVERLQASQGRS